MATEPTHEQLDELLLRWDERRRQGREVPVSELCAACPELAGELERQIRVLTALDPILDPGGDESLRATDSLTDTRIREIPRGGGILPPPRGASPPSSARFRRIQYHAGGGLGDVFIARDDELNREVALKEIKGLFSHDPISRTRFVTEAQVTGNLEHPGIVPVYGLGRYADGRPYYAMRFIRGESLRHAIAQFHQDNRSRRNPGERTRTLHVLLRRFLVVCNAIAYAHSRGVLHRDLKPANIMLGRYGETLVVDWGLAKVMNRPADGGDEEGWLHPAGGDIAVSVPGSASGTPAYMSPEQARGDREQLGPASDVYSLGATLYCILTGRAPFQDEAVNLVLRKVRSGEFPIPRAIDGQVPRALEAICLKAMALKPEDRYAFASALADDIESWLADEPVSAHREPLPDRLVRWGRRYRPLVAGIAAALVIAVAALSISAVLIGRQKDLVEHQKVRAEELLGIARQERSRAESNLGLARTSQAKAEASEKRIRQSLFSSDVRLASKLWEGGDVSSSKRLLEPYLGGRIEHGAKGLFALGYFGRVCRDTDRPILGHHQAEADWAAFSPDGRTLVSHGQGREVLVWDPVARRVRTRIEGLPSSVRGFALQADGTTLVMTGADGSVGIWDTLSGRRRNHRPGPSGVVHGSAISADGRLQALVRGSNDEAPISLWSVESGEHLRTLSDTGGRVDLMIFSPDHLSFATSAGSRVRVWDTVSGRLKADGHQGYPPKALVFSPNGRTLASADQQGIIFWEADTGRQHAAVFLGSETTVMAFAPQGLFMATAEGTGTVTLWDMKGTRLQTLRGHVGPVRSVGYSPDSRLIATASDDKTIRIWDAISGAQLNVLKGHTDRVECVAFTPDGLGLASVGRDATVRLWDPAEWQDRTPLSASVVPAGPPVFSPDGLLLAVPCRDRTVGLLNVATGRVFRTIEPRVAISNVAFSDDGRTLATAEQDGAIRLWRIADGTEQCRLAGHERSAICVAFAGDRMLASGGVDGVVRLWDLTNRKVRAELRGHAAAVKAVVFSAESSTLATASNDRTVRRWDPASGAEKGKPLEHDQAVDDLDFSPDGRLLATVESTGQFKLWDAATGVLSGTGAANHGEGGAVSFSPDGRILAVAGGTGIGLWDVATLHCHDAITSAHLRPILGADFSPAGSTLATTSADGALKVWDTSTSSVRKPSGLRPGSIHSMVFTPDSKTLVIGSRERPSVLVTRPVVGSSMNRAQTISGDQDGSVSLWDVTSASPLSTMTGQDSLEITTLALASDGRSLMAGGQGGVIWAGDLDARQNRPAFFVSPRAERYHRLITFANRIQTWQPAFPVYSENVQAIALSPDGKLLVTATDEGTIKLWDVAESRDLMTLSQEPAEVNCLGFSLEGTRIAAGVGHRVRLWDQGGRSLPSLAGVDHTYTIRCLAFSPDGKTLATGSRDHVIKLWNLYDGGGCIELIGHEDGVESLSFSPDGSILASGGLDRTVRLWDQSTGQELATLGRHAGKVSCVVFSPDGKTLVSGGENPRDQTGEVYLWRGSFEGSISR